MRPGVAWRSGVSMAAENIAGAYHGERQHESMSKIAAAASCRHKQHRRTATATRRRAGERGASASRTRVARRHIAAAQTARRENRIGVRSSARIAQRGAARVTAPATAVAQTVRISMATPHKRRADSAARISAIALRSCAARLPYRPACRFLCAIIALCPRAAANLADGAKHANA